MHVAVLHRVGDPAGVGRAGTHLLTALPQLMVECLRGRLEKRFGRSLANEALNDPAQRTVGLVTTRCCDTRPGTACILEQMRSEKNTEPCEQAARKWKAVRRTPRAQCFCPDAEPFRELVGSAASDRDLSAAVRMVRASVATRGERAASILRLKGRANALWIRAAASAAVSSRSRLRNSLTPAAIILRMSSSRSSRNSKAETTAAEGNWLRISHRAAEGTASAP